MPNRVLLGPTGLKLSVPGVDVVDALPSQLNFSSEYSGIRLLMSGSLIIPGQSTQVVYYPRAFVNRPVCRTGIKLSDPSFPEWWYTAIRPESSAGGSDWSTCFNNRIEFRNQSSSSWRAVYIVWDFES